MEKIVKGATKSKHSPPKAKYIDPLVSSSFAQDGSFHEVCRCLATRLRDPNSTVVFKGLIVVHTLVRAGNQEQVLGYLSGTKVLGLEQVVGGYDIAQNLSKYASYLDRRIRTYGALKYDIIRDKGERKGEREGVKGCNRLRHISVDKGLLRETTLLQKEMDALAECKFYLDDTDDDVTMTALRLLVKDLLLLFQAVNEGVINVLEHYFEMSHPDATTALKIYKRFCMQTENIVTFLGVAKKLQNILNVPIPNLKHAPVSLAGSLEEYLKDPNFEANREEYKENKRVADGKPPIKSTEAKSSTPAVNGSASENKNGNASTSASATTNGKQPKSFTDFFESIESEQASMFNPQTGSPTTAYFQQQATFNPFLPVQMTGFPIQNGAMGTPMQQTGMFSMNGFSAPIQQQPSFGIQPQATGYNPFLQNNQHLQPQMTGFAPGGLLQSQPTGYNPFRQSMIMPAPQTSMPMPSFSSAPNLSNMANNSPFPQVQAQSTNPFPQFAASQQSTAPNQPAFAPSSPFARPASSFQPFSSSSKTPASSAPASAPNQSAPLVAQPTGSRNPFAPPPGSQPAPISKPAQPTLNALAASAFQRANSPQNAPVQPSPNGFGLARPASTPAQPTQPNATQPLVSQQTGGLMSTLASSFATSNLTGNSQPGSALTSNNSFSSELSFGGVPAPLTQQTTGFGGSTVKPFKPSSSFGTSLAESLGPLPAHVSSPPPSLSSQPSVTSVSTGISSAAFNPFRSSTVPSMSTGATSVTPQPNGSAQQPLTSQLTGWNAGGIESGNNFSSQFSNGFGATSFGGSFNFKPATAPQSTTQQQTSLI